VVPIMTKRRVGLVDFLILAVVVLLHVLAWYFDLSLVREAGGNVQTVV
jgi:hypothetical protein